jgi:mercuric ion transport protein
LDADDLEQRMTALGAKGSLEQRMTAPGVKGSLVAGVLAAIGASLCCVVPLVLLALGIGGAWIGNLTALEPYRPIFIALTLLFLGLAFRQLYLTAPACAPGAACADPKVLARQRTVFWVVVVLLGALLAVPWVAPLFY